MLNSKKINSLQGCQPNIETWQRVLQVRTLVLQPDQDTPMWIKFANLARKSGRMNLAQKTIESLRPHVDQVSALHALILTLIDPRTRSKLLLRLSTRI
jgi:hypothetical protein